MAGTHMWDCPQRGKDALTSTIAYSPELYRLEVRCGDCHQLMGQLTDEDRARDSEALAAWADAAGLSTRVVEAVLTAGGARDYAPVEEGQ